MADEPQEPADGDDQQVAPDQRESLRFEFEHDTGAPRRAREALDEHFADGDPLAEPVTLVASELVANVVLHTVEGGSMSVSHGPDDRVRLEVEDRDPRPPVVPDEVPLVGGHGLAIVSQVADDWGVEPAEDGKTVWAEFETPADD